VGQRSWQSPHRQAGSGLPHRRGAALDSHAFAARFEREDTAHAARIRLEAEIALEDDASDLLPLGSTDYDVPATDEYVLLATIDDPQRARTAEAIVEAYGGRIVARTPPDHPVADVATGAGEPTWDSSDPGWSSGGDTASWSIGHGTGTNFTEPPVE
jgi:hypothetical protein